MDNKRKVFLLIMDGFGLTKKTEGNAILLANPEFLNKIFKERPFTRLAASGSGVGLPEGQMGNSEVGHLNIGAGRVVYQEFTRINRAIEDGSFFENLELVKLFEAVKAKDKALHLLGLLSDGGVHSHNKHLYACLKLAKKLDLANVFIHAFMDGRDTSPTHGVHFMRELLQNIQEIGLGKVATVSGRYYPMDRDNRWERIEKAYVAMVHGVGNRVPDPITAMEASYRANVTDEFVQPVIIEEQGNPVCTIQDGDGILAFNFRSDRMRELTKVFTASEFNAFVRKEMKVQYVTMTEYDKHFGLPVAFPPMFLKNILAETLAQEGVQQLRAAETEKYPHVTFFFNGGVEDPFPNEDRFMVPSPKVKTYDLKPEMSAFQLGDLLMEKIHTQKYQFIVGNFANCDMVGHTGIIEAAVKAVNTVDNVLSKVIPVAYELGYDCLITADHGNVEQMIDYDSGEPFTEHTTNPVPFCLLSRESLEFRPDGKLCDIAPTILELFGLEKPTEMEGTSLILRKK